jgi:hypothetical protein
MVVLPAQSQNIRKEGWFDSFPLLAISVIIYNVAAWGGALMAGVGSVQDGLAAGFTVPMPGSGAQWVISVGDVVTWISLILLFIEIVRSTGIGRASIFNHAFSIIVFMICMVEFLLFAPFATSVFFTITVMTLLDVIAGFVISIMTARRDFAIGGG